MQYLPKATLGAVIIAASIGLIEPAAWRGLARVSKVEVVIAAITMIGVIVVGVLPALPAPPRPKRPSRTPCGVDPPPYAMLTFAPRVPLARACAPNGNIHTPHLASSAAGATCAVRRKRSS